MSLKFDSSGFINTELATIINKNLSLRYLYSVNTRRKLYNKEALIWIIFGDSIGESDGSAGGYGYRWCDYAIQKMLDWNIKPNITYTLKTKGGECTDLGISMLSDAIRTGSISSCNTIFICFGRNDSGKLSINRFKRNNESFIRTALANNIDIIFIIENNTYSTLSTPHDTNFNLYADEIIKLCDFYEVDYIDLRPFFNSIYPILTIINSDNTHPNNDGYKLIGEILAHKLIYSTLKDTAKTNTQKLNSYLNAKLISPTVVRGGVPTGTWTSSTQSYLGSEDMTATVYYENNVTNSSFSFSLTSDACDISMLLGVGPDKGNVDIYIDNIFIKTIDCYEASAGVRAFPIIDRASPLNLTTLKIVVKGTKNASSTDTYVRWFSVFYTKYAIRTTLTTDKFTLTGSVGAEGNVKIITNTDGKITFNFLGRYFAFVGSKRSAGTTQAVTKIDGNIIDTVSVYNVSTISFYKQYDALYYGTHTVEFSTTSSGQFPIDISSFTILDSNSLNTNTVLYDSNGQAYNISINTGVITATAVNS